MMGYLALPVVALAITYPGRKSDRARLRGFPSLKSLLLLRERLNDPAEQLTGDQLEA